MPKLLAIILLLHSSNSLSHGGATDATTGCHQNRKTKQFHCHKGPLVGKTFKSKHEIQKQLDSKSQVQQSPSKENLSYQRKNWGSWADSDNDCQNTRAEVLQRDNKGVISFNARKACVVTKGKWYDPYSGKTYSQAKEMDIDHIVPLKHAFKNGGNTWTPAQKKAFANDPDNLLTVSASLNRSKGAKGPARWMPPNQSFWCTYIDKWKRVKQKYALKIGKQEAKKILSIEQECKRKKETLASPSK